MCELENYQIQKLGKAMQAEPNKNNSNGKKKFIWI